MEPRKPLTVFAERASVLHGWEMRTVYTPEYLEALDRAIPESMRTGGYKCCGTGHPVMTEDELCAEHARCTYAITRPMNLPRAPLYVPGEKPSKGKQIPLSAACRRTIELKKKYPHLTKLEAQGVELQKLLDERARREAHELPEAA